MDPASAERTFAVSKTEIMVRWQLSESGSSTYNRFSVSYLAINIGVVVVKHKFMSTSDHLKVNLGVRRTTVVVQCR